MADIYVTATQNWLNATYGNRAGWVNVVVDGETGNATVAALTRALQVELGITALSSSFGAGTLSALTTFGSISATTQSTKPNIVKIVQGALYCKGYDSEGYVPSGGLNGVYSNTVPAAKQLRTDMGVGAGDGSVAPKVFKALLTTDAAVLISGGKPVVRQIQQDLNGRYINRRDFYLMPTDGIYSRNVQTALLFALQYELGIADGVANGNFGPTTQTNLRNQGNLAPGSTDGTKYLVHLFQAALNFNGYGTPYSGVFTTGTANDGPFSGSTASVVSAFQAFAALPVTGTANFTTWASLLVSTGDTARPGTAVDCITTITAARAATLLSAGYNTVGRYLTNSLVTNALDKNIKPGELATIFAAGMKVFPIFQEGGTGTDYFNYQLGVVAGRRAFAAAKGFGFKAGTTIYFAVDFDALEDQVRRYVVPHFRGIRDAFRLLGGGGYQIGIYGARNTCTIVSEAGLAGLSFVSGMSTGFSGNLGFPLPSNWAFDQILEYTIGSGAGAIGIDKNIQSGRDLGQSSVATPVPAVVVPNDAFFASLYWLENLAEEYHASNPSSAPVAELVAQYMRPGYVSAAWVLFAGPRDQSWITHVESRASAESITVIFDYTVGGFSDEDSGHFFASLHGYLRRGMPTSPTAPELVDLGGWAGDLVSVFADFVHDGGASKTTAAATEYGLGSIGNPDVPPASRFPRIDLIQDVDAVNVASRYLSEGGSIARLIQLAVDGEVVLGESRYDTFLRVRFAGFVPNARLAARAVYLQQPDDADSVLFNSGRTMLLQGDDGGAVSVFDLPEASKFALADTFGDVIQSLIS